MARLSFEVKYYRLNLGNSTIDKEKIVGYLNCQNASSDPTHEFTVYFVSDGMKLPAAYCNTSKKTAYIFRPISQMLLFIDILRNEKPVYVGMDDDHPDWTRLDTYPERVGEGE